jgi:hypothetical protein
VDLAYSAPTLSPSRTRPENHLEYYRIAITTWIICTDLLHTSFGRLDLNKFPKLRAIMVDTGFARTYHVVNREGVVKKSGMRAILSVCLNHLLYTNDRHGYPSKNVLGIRRLRSDGSRRGCLWLRIALHRNIHRTDENDLRLPTVCESEVWLRECLSFTG